jgi:periplasmic protein TonB
MANNTTAGSKSYILPAIIGLVLLAALGYFLMGLLGKSDSEDADTSGTTVAAGKDSRVPGADAGKNKTIEALLQEARAAHQKAQYVDPEGSSEVELYLQVLEQEPENRVAQEALLEVIPFATDQTENYIKSGNIPQAERTLALLRRADPNSVILTSLAGKIEQIKRMQSTTQTEVLAQQQAQLAQAQARAAAQQTAATPDQPTEPVTETPSSSVSTPAVAATSRPTPTPTPATSPSEPAPVPAPTPAADDRPFQLLKRVDPVYPQRALRQRITGWVEMTFTITPNGDVTAIAVVDSQPRREFDREATKALSQWKFKPRIEGGKPVAASARQRLEFKL